MAEKVITLGFATDEGQYIIREVNEAEFIQFYMRYFMKLKELDIGAPQKRLLRLAEWYVKMAAKLTFRTINQRKGGQTRGFSGQQGGLSDLL